MEVFKKYIFYILLFLLIFSCEKSKENVIKNQIQIENCLYKCQNKIKELDELIASYKNNMPIIQFKPSEFHIENKYVDYD